MADFIAVIRRAVDGLSDNTPEMRAKVYDRARSAVVRQLENMKPRPPEAMFQRQLDKLDAAIQEVEDEHTEALPAETAADPVEETPVQQAAEEPEYAEPAYSEPEPATEVRAPVQEEVHAEPEVPQEPAYHAETVEPAYVEEAAYQPHAEYQPEPVATEPSSIVAPETYQPTAAHSGDDTVRSAPVFEDDHRDHVIEQAPVLADIRDQTVQVAGEPARWAVDIDEEPEVPPVDDTEPVPMPKVSYDENEVVTGFNEFVQREMNRTVVPPPPKKADRKEEFSWDAPFDDLPEVPKPDAFEKALEAKQRELASQAVSREADKAQPSARTELEELIGFEREPSAQPVSSTAASDLPPDVTRVVSKLEGKSFRHQKKRKKSRFSPAAIGLGVAGALLLGGGAYALWAYKDNVTKIVADLMPAADTAKPVDKPAADTKSTNTASGATNAKKPVESDKSTEVASAETGPQKFTQRLLADGSESDTNAAKLPVDQALKEGTSVAGQTEPGKKVAEADAASATTDATKPAAGTPALGVTQKMFLYEERLGQTSPVAVNGTIVWSEKNDNADGKPNPTIEAQIDIPERKITALMTFKRNTDPSLPASHIVEIVFAMPKDFPEGNVESIQRIAFKQTEQDRGNPLFAVPAKITDDFHMVALNDDVEARKANLDLMKRPWIDIPITYRNGRRALITLEKGATGTAVFDKVLSEWSALGDQSQSAN
jgi:hypothetical protein